MTVPSSLSNLNLTTFNKIYPLLIQKYNTLVPDPNANILDKINSIIDYLNSVGNLSNEVVDNWNKVMSWTMADGLTTDVNNKIEAMNTSGELNSILTSLFNAEIGDLTTLQTNDKSKIVNAINEVDQLAKSNQTNVGTLSSLSTTSKNNLVAAINENQGKIATNITNISTNTANIGTLSNLQTAHKTDLVSAVNDNVASLADKTQRLSNIWIDVKADYGAKGDGVTDDSQAFINAIAYAESKITSDTSYGGSNNRGNVVIYIPSGSYVITQKEALMRSTFTSSTAGLVIKGAGRFITQIQFKPSQTGSYLLNNQNGWLHVHISDINFNCNDTTSSFMLSYSTGQAQNYSFERCQWNGQWQYCLYLQGTNNNSEMSWMHCGYTGTWNKAIYVSNSNGSDQFLNYNFFATNFEGVGEFLHFELGGNINIWGGSFIHTGSAGGTFFNLNNPSSGSHFYGTQRFLCVGARMEHRFTTSTLINCDWNDGTVAFISCDTSSQSNISGASTMAVAQFTSINQKMPNIKFDNCSLMGQHQYTWGSTSYTTPHNVVYENCEITNFNKPSDFIVFSGTTNWGGEPLIKFRNCRGISDKQNYIWDTVLNWHTNMAGLTQKKIVSFANINGAGLPATSDGSLDMYLPMNSVITNVIFYSPASGTSQTMGSSFTVQTTETTPTVLGTISFSNYSSGFNYSNPQFFPCKSDQTRHIQLVPGAGITSGNGNGYAIVEYI